VFISYPHNYDNVFKFSMAVTPLHAKFEAVAKGSPAEFALLLSELGYNGIEYSVLEPETIIELVRIASDYGLRVPAIGTGLNYIHYGLDLTSPDEGVRARTLNRLQSFVEYTGRSEAGGVIIGLIRGRGDSYSSPETALNLLAAQLSTLCRQAVDADVRLFLEPLNRYESKIINTVGEALNFLRRVDCPNLYLLLDTFHMNIEEPVIEDSIRVAGDKIGHFHVADSNRYAPGMGHLDFSSILKALKDTGYSGYVSAEIIVKPDFESAARLTLNTLRIASGCEEENR